MINHDDYPALSEAEARMIVTIVTPTFNAAQFLERCLQSVRSNASSDVEIDHVICDGGSTDGTVEIARAFGCRVLVEGDDGIFDAINKGSRNSAGELLGFLGGDDVLLPGAIQRITEAYRSSGRRWVVGGIQWIDDHDRLLGGLAAPPAWMTPRMLASLGWNPVMHMATYFSRDLFDELGGFDLAYRVSGDYDMMLRARSIAPYARVRQPIACFRRTGANASCIGGQRLRSESAAVLARFGARSPVERRLWAMLTKFWFNTRNPRWFLYKTMEPLLVAAGKREKAYF